jgi:hypothetical protein
MKSSRNHIFFVCLSVQTLLQPMLHSQDAGPQSPERQIESAESQLIESRKKVAELEAAMKKIEGAISGEAAGTNRSFSWAIHNELRHFYAGQDLEKSFAHCEVILKNSLMDSYILNILGGWAEDPETEAKNLLISARKFPRFACVSAACRIQAAGLTPDAATRRELLDSVAALEGEELESYKTIARTILIGLGGAK